MAEPTGTPSTPRSPFAPPQAPSPRTGGPAKPLVIGCLVVLILAGIGLIASLYYVGQSYEKIFAWSLSRIRDGVQERLPKDLSAEAKQRRLAMEPFSSGRARTRRSSCRSCA